MLVLGRRLHETVVVRIDGREIVFSIQAVDHGRVSVGVEADRDVVILRGEIVGTPAEAVQVGRAAGRLAGA